MTLPKIKNKNKQKHYKDEEETTKKKTFRNLIFVSSKHLKNV